MAMVIFLKKRSNSKREKLKRMCNLTMLHPVFLYHSLYTVYFIRFWKLQLSTWLPPLGCSQHTTGWSIFLIYFFFFFFQIGYDLYVFGKKWPVIGHTQQSSIFLSFFFFSRKEKKKKKKRGDACFVCCHYTHHTLTHCLTERTIKRKTCYEWTIKRKKYFLLYFYFK